MPPPQRHGPRPRAGKRSRQGRHDPRDIQQPQGTGGALPGFFIIVAQSGGETVQGRRILDLLQGPNRLPVHLRIRRLQGVHQKGNDLLRRLDAQHPGSIHPDGFGFARQVG